MQRESLHDDAEGACDARGELARLLKRCERERRARMEAERILESKSLEVFRLNQDLLSLNARLESRVVERTKELVRAKQAALQLLETDHLTKVSSRYRYNRQLENYVMEAMASGQPFCLLLLDVDNFKQINDTYGHAYGDELLIQVAARMSVVARQNDQVARLGGDELAILAAGTDSAGGAALAERLQRDFVPAFNLLGTTIRCTLSIGVAAFPAHADCPETLQRAADLALYKAKQDGRCKSVVFDPKLLESHRIRYLRELQLKRSVASREIEAWYQPIVDLKSGRIRGVEALARFRGDDGEYIRPDIFIPLAEECGLIHELGRAVLRRALDESRTWIGDGLLTKVSVNVSPSELIEPGFASDVLDTLSDTRVSSRNLVLEITEEVMLGDLEVAGRVVNELVARGVSFFIDDFGLGYTNLSYLRKLPLSGIKLDRSLIADVGSDTNAQAIVRHMAALCTDLGLLTVCEGIETTSQNNVVQSLGCHLAQGYMFGQPMPPDIFEQTLSKKLSAN